MNVVSSRKHAWLCLVFALACLASASSAFAGKKPGGNPPPPPPPPDPATIYEYRADLGGWLDTTRNLVWGYNCQPIEGPKTLNQAKTFAANYATALANYAINYLPGQADLYEMQADWQTEQGNAALAAGNVALAEDWFAAAEVNYARAQLHRDSIAPTLAAAEVASNYTWRVPTQAEATDAMWKGLFTYGEGGLNGYDQDPLLGLQQVYQHFHWTTTLKKQTAFVYNPTNGDTGFIGVNSGIYCIVVRTHVP